LVNHNGFLYWIEANGNWYFKGRTPENQMSESEKREARAYQQQNEQTGSASVNPVRLADLPGVVDRSSLVEHLA
jgi:hypothetical protein